MAIRKHQFRTSTMHTRTTSYVVGCRKVLLHLSKVTWVETLNYMLINGLRPSMTFVAADGRSLIEEYFLSSCFHCSYSTIYSIMWAVHLHPPSLKNSIQNNYRLSFKVRTIRKFIISQYQIISGMFCWTKNGYVL